LRDSASLASRIRFPTGTGDSGWSLEVIDQEGASTVWDDLFATDHEALAEFYQTLEAEGVQSSLIDRTRLN
jgi:hypothetical protein